MGWEIPGPMALNLLEVFLMSSHFKGPILENESINSSRACRSHCPIDVDADYVKVCEEDFVSLVDGTVWDIVKDAGASVAAADQAGGAIQITSTATTDNDGGSVQMTSEVVKLVAGKRMWFEASVKMSDVLQSEMYVGLAETFATNPEAVLASAEMCGFIKADGDAEVNVKTEKAGTATSEASGVDMVNNTYIVFSMFYDGGSNVVFYVNRKQVAAIITNLPDKLMKPCIFSLSGDASGTKMLTADYIHVVVER